MEDNQITRPEQQKVDSDPFFHQLEIIITKLDNLESRVTRIESRLFDDSEEIIG